MRKTIFFFVLICNTLFLSAEPTIISYHADSLYTVQYNGYGFCDNGEGHSLLVEIADEIPSSEVRPILRTAQQNSHAQLWICESLTDSTFTFRNYKTGRYIWTDYQLPKSGKTWNEAASSKEWDILPSVSDIEKLYMGPDAKTLGLKGINGFTSYAFDGEVPANRMYVFPINNNNALLGVSNSKPINGWNIQRAFHKDNVAADNTDETSNMITQLSKTIKIIGNKVIANEECCIYGITGVRIARFVGERVLERGFYILTTCDGCQKVFIP